MLFPCLVVRRHWCRFKQPEPFEVSQYPSTIDGLGTKRKIRLRRVDGQSGDRQQIFRRSWGSCDLAHQEQRQADLRLEALLDRPVVEVGEIVAVEGRIEEDGIKFIHFRWWTLSGIIEGEKILLRKDPYSGHLFVFRGGRGNLMTR